MTVLKKEQPNIFRFATKELSQDAFFTWLLNWADNNCSQYNTELCETAKDFVKLLLNKPSDFNIAKIEAGRQWNNIDIWVEVNDEYFIAIEDKTHSGEHSGQLERYKEIATEHYKGKNYKLHFVYLKTGNESNASLQNIVKKGYEVIDRKTILEVLNKRTVRHHVFNEFKDYLTGLEEETNSFYKYENLTSHWQAAEGFFIKLQELLNEKTDWRYVANPTGGFLGFWYHWTWPSECSLYIQIENAFDYGIKVVVKIGDWEPNVQTLYRILGELQPLAKKHHLTITKPDKFRAGQTSTLAVAQNAFTVNDDGILDVEGFIQVLSQLEMMLDEYEEMAS